MPRIVFPDFKDTSAAQSVDAVAAVSGAGIPAKADPAILCFEIVLMRMPA